MAEQKIQTSAGMETPTETVNRIKSSLSSPTASASAAPVTNGADNAAFITEVQNRLVGQLGAISSMDSELESTFGKAISGIQTSQEKSAQRIQSEFGRQSGYLQQDAQDAFSAFGEERSGFATQMVAFRRLVDTTDRSMKDLEQRKEELLLSGESQAASQIAQLQVQQLQFKQQAQQQLFSNMLGLGQFGLGVKQFDLDVSRENRLLQESQATTARLERQQAFQESQAIGEIQLLFPEANFPEDVTLEEAVKLAQPFAKKDKERQAQLEALRASGSSTASTKITQLEDSAVLLYGGIFQDALAAGANPQQAFSAVLAQAANDGLEVPMTAYAKFAALQAAESQVTSTGSEITGGSYIGSLLRSFMGDGTFRNETTPMFSSNIQNGLQQDSSNQSPSFSFSVNDPYTGNIGAFSGGLY